MNRAARRQAARAKPARPESFREERSGVALVGGPMDGWVVKPDAPALRPGWTPPPQHRSVLSVLSRGAVAPSSGRYVLDAGVNPPRATWVEG